MEDIYKSMQEAAERGHRKRLAATSETAPAMVQESVERMLASINKAPTGRLLRLETLTLASIMLPRMKKSLGPRHALTKEWKKLHDETLAWLEKSNNDRYLKRC